MWTNLKDVLRDLMPPLLLRTLRRFRVESEVTEWVYIPDGWAYAKSHGEVKGWNVPDILDVYKKKWPKFESLVQGTAPLGLSHESTLTTTIDINTHNMIISFAYAIALASHGLESLSMLDWGGGIGHYYLLAKAVLPDVRIDYHCMDVPLFTEYGSYLFPNQHFYADESCLKHKYDFVIASGSLHYAEAWQKLLAGLAGATQEYLYIARLPIVLQTSSYVFLQRPYSYGYNTEFLAWCLNRTSFLDETERLGLILLREFFTAEHRQIKNAPGECEFRGFLFRSSERRKKP
jgi:putative methyltransferase (TIGR04325 family)